MQRAEAQHKPIPNKPVARQAKGMAITSPRGERIAQLDAVEANGPRASKLAQLALMANDGPRVAAQRRIAAGLNDGAGAAAQGLRPEGLGGDPLQRAETERSLQPQVAQRAAAPAQPNRTGLPDNLKHGIEAFSGISMDSVRVHYNSSQPARLNALAYAQGTEIHVAPGQERHLAHEAWHVVQQAQGRVQPSWQMKGFRVNTDRVLEAEANRMGGRARRDERAAAAQGTDPSPGAPFSAVVRGAARGANPPLQMASWGDWITRIGTGLLTVGGTAMAIGTAPAWISVGAGATALAGGVGLYRNLTQDRRAVQGLADRMSVLEAYQHDAAAPGQESRLADQYQGLDNVEQEAHRWLRERSRHASKEDRNAMGAVLARIDDYRTTLTALTLQGNDEMWTPAGMQPEAARNARAIWNSIRAGQQNVTISGGGDFRTRVLADMSKLLQSRQGRAMLSDLNAPQGDGDRRITIASADANQAKPRTSDNAFELDGIAGRGTGSDVTVSHAADKYLMGANDEPLHPRRFISLGHELGHARRFLAGRGHDILKRAPVANEEEIAAWGDAEEHGNITNEENPLRRELGLPERRFHGTYLSVRGGRQLSRYAQQYNEMIAAFRARGGDVMKLNEGVWDAAARWVQTIPVEGIHPFQSPEHAPKANRDLLAFQRELRRH